MMDKTYILENGMLELYVLGELNPKEHQQVGDGIKQHSELRDLVAVIESSFEQLAIENGIDVPESVKTALMNKISKPEVKTIPMDATSTIQSYIWMAASVAILLLICSVYLFSELNTLKQDFQVVSEENRNLNKRIIDLNSSLAETNKWYETINNSETEKYVLKGNSSMPEAIVIGYINDIKKAVVINTTGLPEIDDDHDYQMWADVDGVMVDMGVIDIDKDMMAMTYIDNAESLNITIEEKGGSDHPDVSKLVTNVYLK